MPGPLGEGGSRYYPRSQDQTTAQHILEKIGKKKVLKDCGFAPHTNTWDKKLSGGRAKVLGSAATLTTPEGIEATRKHYGDVFRIEGLGVATTPTWGASRAKFDLAEDLPPDVTVQNVIRRGVEIVAEARDKAGSNALVALSTRGPRDSATGEGRFSSVQTAEMFAEQNDLLVNAARQAGLKDGEYVLLGETFASLEEGAIFTQLAAALGYPHIVSARPNKKGRLVSGESWREFAQAIKNPSLVAAGFNCNGVPEIEMAREFAREEDARLLLGLYVANGGYGVIEELGRKLPIKEARQRDRETVEGLVRGAAEPETIFVGGCCGTEISTIKKVGRALRIAGPSEPIHRREQRSSGEYLVYGGAGAR